MTKPRLAKVRALFYVLQQLIKRGCAYFDTASFFRLCVELSVKPRCQFVVKTHYTVVRRGHFRFLGMMFILYCAWKRKNLGSVLTYLTVRPCALTAYCTELS